MREELELEKVEEKLKEMKEIEEVEENIYFPSHYSESGCPTVPLAFSGMTGRQLPPKSQQPTISALPPTTRSPQPTIPLSTSSQPTYASQTSLKPTLTLPTQPPLTSPTSPTSPH